MDRFVVAATDVGDCREMLDQKSWEEPKSTHIGSTKGGVPRGVKSSHTIFQSAKNAGALVRVSQTKSFH